MVIITPSIIVIHLCHSVCHYGTHFPRGCLITLPECLQGRYVAGVVVENIHRCKLMSYFYNTDHLISSTLLVLTDIRVLSLERLLIKIHGCNLVI